MKFTPKTESEIANNWVAGIYDFEVVAATDEVSKNGNDMLHLDVRIFDNQGHGRLVTDYLVATDATAYKIRHFAEATGLLPVYEKGEMTDAMVLGKTGRCKVAIDADKTGQYPDKNVIRDYVKPNGAMPAAKEKELDDSIPF